MFAEIEQRKKKMEKLKSVHLKVTCTATCLNYAN